MEKKKILFIAMSLNVGGAEKSLVNLLNLIDYNKFDVDLLLFQKKGAFLKQVPKEVSLYNVDEIGLLYNNKCKEKTKLNIFKRLYLKFIRYTYSLYEKIKWKQFDRIRIHRWIDKYSKIIPDNLNGYDVGIAYAGGETAYYLMDKVNAKKKVYYFHSDYSKIDIDVSLESRYVEKADLIVTISEACANSLRSLFPNVENRIAVLQNITSPNLIKKLSTEYEPSEFHNEEKFRIVSVGRLVDIKGYDMAIEAANILKKHDIDFIWCVVGEGSERKNLEELIKKYDLQNNFLLIGLRENPYPYILKSDLLVQPSRFEGKSLVLDEAKILNTPILATNYNSINDQITDRTNGIIVDMNPKSIAEALEEVIFDKKILLEIKKNISKEVVITDNVDEYLNKITQ